MQEKHYEPVLKAVATLPRSVDRAEDGADGGSVEADDGGFIFRHRLRTRFGFV
jgi:hypothetical protein